MLFYTEAPDFNRFTVFTEGHQPGEVEAFGPSLVLSVIEALCDALARSQESEAYTYCALPRAVLKYATSFEDALVRKYRWTVIAALAAMVVACGGSRVLKEARPLELQQPLASAEDQQLAATLDWVIVRDGPGSWAKNADWDEYLLRVRNRSERPLRVTTVHVQDSLGTRVARGENRRELVSGARQAARRYRAHGLEVKAGMGGAALAASGGAVYSASAAVGVAALSSGSTAAAMGAVAGIVVVAPALALGGVVRGVNNSKVDRQIKSRRTALPLELAPGQEARLVVFFPLTPSPNRLTIGYDDQRELPINTQPVLAGLHLGPG